MTDTATMIAHALLLGTICGTVLLAAMFDVLALAMWLLSLGGRRDDDGVHHMRLRRADRDDGAQSKMVRGRRCRRGGYLGSQAKESMRRNHDD